MWLPCRLTGDMREAPSVRLKLKNKAEAVPAKKMGIIDPMTKSL
jgi:hypothetical protein